mgnify:CR=1 FL=1
MKTKIGDYFKIPLEDGRFGIGCVLARTPPAFYIGALKDVFSKVEDFDCKSLKNPKSFAILGSFFDSKIKNGDWQILGNYRFPLNGFPKPYIKIKRGDDYVIETLLGRDYVRDATPEDILYYENPSNKSPMILQNALNALHGLKEWNPKYKKVSEEFVRKQADLQ